MNFNEPLPDISPSFWYVATPYSKYEDGSEEAFRQACLVSASLLQEKIPFFCPIAHTHSINKWGGACSGRGWMGLRPC